MGILDTEVRNVRNVLRYTIGSGALGDLCNILIPYRETGSGQVLYFVDEYFETSKSTLEKLDKMPGDKLIFISAAN